MANNKKHNPFGATLRARVQNNEAQTEPKQAAKTKRTKKPKKTAKAKAVKPSTRLVDDMSDREFDLLLQEAQRNNASVQQSVPSTSDIVAAESGPAAESSPTVSSASSVVHDTASNHEQHVSKPNWTIWLPEIKRLESEHDAVRYIEIEKEVARRKRAIMVQSIMDIRAKIAACESTTCESDVYDAPLEETMAPQHADKNVQTDNAGVQAEASPASPKSPPSTPEPKNSFWVPGIENMQLFSFDFDQSFSSPSSSRSLSPPRSSSPLGVQTHPCPPMSANFEFNFPSTKAKKTEPTPASVDRRIATPKSKKKKFGVKPRPDAGSRETINDNDEVTTHSRSTSSSTLNNGGDQALSEVIIGAMEESHLVAAFNKMIGITKTRDLNLKREMRLKVEALMNELAEMERNANPPDQQETSTDEELSSP